MIYSKNNPKDYKRPPRRKSKEYKIGDLILVKIIELNPLDGYEYNFVEIVDKFKKHYRVSGEIYNFTVSQNDIIEKINFDNKLYQLVK